MIRWRPADGNRLASGLVGAWLLTDRSGLTARDASGFKNTGTLTSFAGAAATDWKQTIIGPTLDFRDANDRMAVTTNGVLNNLSALTVIWATQPRFGAATGTGRRAIIMKASNTPQSPTNGWAIADTNSFAEFTFRMDFASTDLEARTVAFHRVNGLQINAITWNGGLTASTSVTFYRNGVIMTHSRDTNGAGAQASDTANAMTIGNTSGSTAGWSGFLGPILIWNRALSTQEVRQMTSDMFLPFRSRDNRYFALTPVAAPAPAAVVGSTYMSLTGVGI